MKMRENMKAWIVLNAVSRLSKISTNSGVLIQVEPHLHSVGHSERSDVIVEPYLSLQWFVKMDPLAEKALQEQQGEDKINFIPQRFENTYVRWMENIRDRCVSRQLWWGHRIPAW